MTANYELAAKAPSAEVSATGFTALYDQLFASVRDVENAWSAVRHGFDAPLATPQGEEPTGDRFERTHSLIQRLRWVANEMRDRA